MSEVTETAGGEQPEAPETAEAPPEIPDRFFVGHVIEQAGAAVIRNHLEAAGYRVDPTGKLIAKPGDCDQCGRHARLHSAFNKAGRFLCPLCWQEDMCST